MNLIEGNLLRPVPEGFVIEEYKSERLSEAQLRRLPGFESRYELDDFLTAHQARSNVTIEDVRRNIEDLRGLGL